MATAGVQLNKKRKISQLQREDFINKLPNDILISIISHLSLKEAIRTSVLSQRWRNLWKSTSRLDFDDSILVPKTRRGAFNFFQCDTFSNLVNNVLESHQNSRIDEFSVCSYLLGRDEKSRVDRWLKFALDKRVQKLHLNLEFGAYTLPTQFLHNHRLHSITGLRLENLHLTSEVVEILLSHCPCLEVLQLTGSRGLVHLKIYGHWLKLKKLEILFCRDLEYVEISRTNLVSFKYFGPNISILLYDVPHLIEASIRGGVVFHFLKNMSEFSAYLSQLETFELDLMSLAIIGTCPKFPMLSNVKHLELAIYAYDAYDLLCCTSFLVLSPSLRTLKLKILGLECFPVQREKKKQKAKPHCFLKVIELGGFLGYAIYVELADNLLSRALSLKKMVIDPCAYSGGERKERNDLERVLDARACAVQLEMSLPPGAELVIL